MALIKIDGTEMPLDDEIAKDDATLKAALTPFYPGAANSDIKRETKDGQMIVTVVKKAGTKGGYEPIIEALKSAPEHINPAIALAVDLQRKERAGELDVTAIMKLDGEIKKAIKQGEKEHQLVHSALRSLITAPPIPASVRPQGF